MIRTTTGESHPAPADGPPTLVVGSSWSRGPMALGLDRPFELRGGDRVGRDGLAATLPLDWLPEFMDLVGDECFERDMLGTGWFGLPPVALVGPEGSGRTHVARQLARHAGLPLVVLDVAGDEGVRRLLPAALPPEVGMASDLVVAMAASCCANPVVLVTGCGEADAEALAALECMVDRHAGCRWLEEGIEAAVDLSCVTWLVAVDDEGVLPHGLMRQLQVVGTRLPLHESHDGSTPAEQLMLLGLVDEVLADLGMSGPVSPDTWRLLSQPLRERWTWRRFSDLHAKVGAILTARR